MQETIIYQLKAEQNDLGKLIRRLQTQLGQVPDGSLQISTVKGKVHYYQYTADKTTGQKIRTYLKESKAELAGRLAQKDYNLALLQDAKKQFKNIERFLKVYDPGLLKDRYQKLSPERRKLVIPGIIPDDVFIRQWESVAYLPGSFRPDDPEYYTMKGERVRSKSEKIIADTLYQKSIPYRYEYPLKLRDGRVWRADFQILNKRTRREYIQEHFGMMDNPSYCNNAIGKIYTYAQNGIFPGEKLIITAETSTRPFSTAEFDLIIRNYYL
ncbi:MAG: hypothetical protein IJ106_10605 [Parasporobacterium sp.]|nr:hypothetical protein [Parasporobacterium sp.]